MNVIIIIICKCATFLLKLVGKGSSFPGTVALKLNKNILNYFKLPNKIIFVTGTNGKSTISSTLSDIYNLAGYKVSHNYKGSNLMPGITSTLIQNSSIFGKVKSDVLVLELDERYVKYVLKFITPTYFIINNISRDQPPRQGHFDFVFEEVKKNITDDIHLILNADDPIINKFSINHKGPITYYGLAKMDSSSNMSELNYDDTLDIMYCPICNKKLVFDYIHRGDIGKYKCPSGDFERKEPLFETHMLDISSFEIDSQIIRLENHFLYNVYNLSACYTLAKIDNIEPNIIVEVLNNLKFNRLETIPYNNKHFHFLLGKLENAASFNQTLNYINDEKNDKTLIIGFNIISIRYNFWDLSWLWDAKFEYVNNDSMKQIICVGRFANDIAVRLKLANIPSDKVIICDDFDSMEPYLKHIPTDHVYCMLYKDLEDGLKKYLRGNL